MMVLITYDVETSTREGRRRFRKVARVCTNFGQRVQNSVFECILNPAQLSEVRHLLEDTIDKERDSLRFYHLGSNWTGKVDHIGAKPTFNPEDDHLII